MNTTIKICVYKHKNIPHYEFETELIESSDNYVLVYGKPNRKFTHHTKNFTINVKEPDVEYFALNDWYTVGIEKNETGGYKYYCNINEPPRFENNVISFIDYDIDVVNNGSEWQTVDEDEFQINSKKYNYPQEIIDTVLRKEKELRDRITDNKFPFDGWLLNYADIYLKEF